MDYRKELDRLYEIEYGDVPELAFRLAATGIGAYVHYNYTESSLALFWYSGFALTHAVYFTVLRRRPDVCTLYDTIKCGMLFLVMLLAFIWFPASLVASDDIALRISGTAGTGAGERALTSACVQVYHWPGQSVADGKAGGRSFRAPTIVVAMP